MKSIGFRYKVNISCRSNIIPSLQQDNERKPPHILANVDKKLPSYFLFNKDMNYVQIYEATKVAPRLTCVEHKSLHLDDIDED